MNNLRVLLRKSRQSIDLSLGNLTFIFENLQPPFEHGIHLYKTTKGKNLFILDSWASEEEHRYSPSATFSNIEKRIEQLGHISCGFFHNHNLADLENDDKNKVLILPSNIDIWNSSIPYAGLVRNFRHFSDLRVFLRDISADYPYPPQYIIKINTPIGIGTRIISAGGRFSIEDEGQIEFEDNGYVERSISMQLDP